MGRVLSHSQVPGKRRPEQSGISASEDISLVSFLRWRTVGEAGKPKHKRISM